ncbi:MAG: antibiotic biosynthesis monooxygenase family protein [Nannocystales bacterium]
MPQIHVINAIEVPAEMDEVARQVRDTYVRYFSEQPGFVGSTFYKALDSGSSYSYINVVVWESQEAFDAVVNAGFNNDEGENDDGLKVLGKGFPPPIVVHPGRYEVIRSSS